MCCGDGGRCPVTRRGQVRWFQASSDRRCPGRPSPWWVRMPQPGQPHRYPRAHRTSGGPTWSYGMTRDGSVQSARQSRSPAGPCRLLVPELGALATRSLCRQVRVQHLYPKTVPEPAVRTMLGTRPKKSAARSGQPPTDTIGGQPLRDTGPLAWCGEVIRSVLADLAVGVLFTSSGRVWGCAELVKTSAVVLGAGLLLAGCGSVKFGAAATTSNDPDHDRDPHHRGHQP